MDFIHVLNKQSRAGSNTICETLINVCFDLLGAVQVGLTIQMVSDKLSITERWD